MVIVKWPEIEKQGDRWSLKRCVGYRTRYMRSLWKIINLYNQIDCRRFRFVVSVDTVRLMFVLFLFMYNLRAIFRNDRQYYFLVSVWRVADGNHVDSGRGVHVSKSFRQDVLSETVREPHGQVTELPETKTSQERSIRAAFWSRSLCRNCKSDQPYSVYLYPCTFSFRPIIAVRQPCGLD